MDRMMESLSQILDQPLLSQTRSVVHIIIPEAGILLVYRSELQTIKTVIHSWLAYLWARNQEYLEQTLMENVLLYQWMILRKFRSQVHLAYTWGKPFLAGSTMSWLRTSLKFRVILLGSLRPEQLWNTIVEEGLGLVLPCSRWLQIQLMFLQRGNIRLGSVQDVGMGSQVLRQKHAM